ncbi:hypothetical protein D3C71_1107840 [compost metagenome]
MQRTGVANVVFRDDRVIPSKRASVCGQVKLEWLCCLHRFFDEGLPHQPRNNCIRERRNISWRNQAGGLKWYQVNNDQFAFKFDQLLFVELHHVHRPQLKRFVDGVDRHGLEQEDCRNAAVFLGEQVNLHRASRKGGQHFFKPYGGQAGMGLFH